MVISNPIINNIVHNSRTNIPMLLPVAMNGEVEAIWKLAGRHRGLIVQASGISFTELIVFAQGDYYDGILLHSVECLNESQQIQLAHILIKLQPKERGKFIFTTANFELLNDELAKILCKVKSSVIVSEKSSPDRYIGQIG